MGSIGSHLLRIMWIVTGNLIFSDESVFSSANDGPVRVYRPQGTRYNAEYVKESARSSRVSVAVWGWISSRGIGLLHRIDGRLDRAQYLHILRDIMVPSVREMYPDGVINFQQEQSSVHKSQLLQRWLADQNEVELLDWPPCGADLHPIENGRRRNASWPKTGLTHPQLLRTPYGMLF
jgi:hypothetical protein